MIAKKYIYIFVIVLIVVAIVIMRNKYNQNNAQENFDEKANKLVLYYTDWCGHSQRFLPVWDEFDAFVKGKKMEVTLEKVDCEKQKDRCTNIKGFPTVILQKDGKEIELDNKYKRTIEGLSTFLKDAGL